MAAFIFHASGIVKRYLAEIGNAAAMAEGIAVDDPTTHPQP
jgi:hypothetical protein